MTLSSETTAEAVQGRTAVLESPTRVSFRETTFPPPQGDWVRVRLEGCGICGSNLPVWEGRPWFEYPREPGSPGHEGWGVVDAVGPTATGVAVGDRVSLLSYHAFATHDYAEAANVVRMPDRLADVPFPGEAVGCAQNVFQRCGVQAEDTVCVVGVGFLGALLIQLAHAAGARVIAVSRRPFSLRIAEQCGAAQTVPLHAPDLDQRIGEWTGGNGCQCVIEATGEQQALDVAARHVTTRGRLVIAGFHQDGPRSVDMQSWNWRGIDVINAHERDPAIYIRGIQQAVESVSRGALDLSMLMTHHYPLDELGAALQTACERPEGFLKAWVSMPATPHPAGAP